MIVFRFVFIVVIKSGTPEKLKSYTIIFHIISNQISTTETNYRKNKHDRNDQCWLNTSTTSQKCKCWFCFRLVFVLFFSPLVYWLGREQLHVTTPECDGGFNTSQPPFLDSFWGIERVQCGGSTVGQDGSYWLGGIASLGHTATNNPNTQRHGLFNKHTDTTWWIRTQIDRLGHKGWVGILCVCVCWYVRGRNKDWVCVCVGLEAICATFNKKKKIQTKSFLSKGKQFTAWEALKMSEKK